MNTQTKTLTAPAPEGYKGQLIAKVEVNGYFSVTGEISTPIERNRGDAQCGGCIHEELSKAFPQLNPLIALHLSDCDGAPMHAEANGWYWLEGAAGGLGGKYHGGSGSYGQTTEKCLSILAEHLRIDLEYARSLVSRAKAGIVTKENFGSIVDSHRPRWKAEAASGLELIASL
jgi:hypothetical protein